MKRAAAVVGPGLLLGLLLACVPTAADAAAYRYWQYWRIPADGAQWAFATTGPATRPADGAVEGWRFGISGTAGDDKPRRDATGLFDQVCGATPPQNATKRVAVVIDFGTAADAPTGERPPAAVTGCAQLPASGTGYDALQQVATARTAGGLVCGIGGYPIRECGATVKSAPTESAAASPTSRATPGVPAPTATAGVGDVPGAAPRDVSTPTAAGAATTAPAAAATPTPQTSSEPTSPARTTSPAIALADSEPAAETDAGRPTATVIAVALLAALLAAGVALRRGRS